MYFDLRKVYGVGAEPKAVTTPTKLAKGESAVGIGDFMERQINPTPVLNPNAGSPLPVATQPVKVPKGESAVGIGDFMQRQINTPTALISAEPETKLTPLIIAGIALKLLL